MIRLSGGQAPAGLSATRRLAALKAFFFLKLLLTWSA
jgi:hypothetical protein